MSVSRRSFMGVLTGALAGAKAAGAQLAGVSALYGSRGEPHSGSPYSVSQGSVLPTTSKSYVERLRRRLTELDSHGRRAEFRAQLRRYPPSRLDPDLAAMQSFSLSARLRIQAERDIERFVDAERVDLGRAIAEAIAEGLA